MKISKSNRPIFALGLLSLVFSGLSGCLSSASPVMEDIPKIGYNSKKIAVTVSKASFGVFEQELTSNGKVSCEKFADLAFPFVGEIRSVLVKNGEHVHKGQILGTLKPENLKRDFNKYREQLDRALIELDDRLIDYGFRLKDSARVPTDIMKMAKIKSGYDDAAREFSNAKDDLEKSVLRAPFEGRVANLNVRPFNPTTLFNKFCSIMDDTEMQVDFSLLETEIQHINIGSAIFVSRFGETGGAPGVITEINPQIEPNGMIQVHGKLKNPTGLFINGMSVSIIVKGGGVKKIFIPKQAVVHRQERDVVFTYEHGKSIWNYVKTAGENSKYIAIESGIKKNQLVIISNNATLAHETMVSINNEE